MKSLRLYEIADQYQFLLNDLYDHDTGEIKESALEKLNALSDSIEDKAINITRLFKDLESNLKAIEKERKAMAARETGLKNQIKRLKDYLRSNMERCEINKIECPQFVIRLQNNPPAVEIIDDFWIPQNYKKIKIENDIEKIKEDLQKGIEIPGVHLIQRKGIRIR